MKLELMPYVEQLNEWPNEGHHIMAQYNDDKIVVYQSYRPEIGNYAAKNQYFGGAFSLNRMTWIKPNFLWMMYRNGWGTKVGQEVVLAIHLKREAFERYVANAVHSTYKSEIYESKEEWKTLVKESDIRLQWDPDHDPYGAKLERRAIQIGIRGEQIVHYSKDDIIEIEDITEYVRSQGKLVTLNQLDKLMLPKEKPLLFTSNELNKKLNIKT